MTAKAILDEIKVGNLYGNGTSENKVAKIMGVSRTVIRRVLIEKNVKIRNQSESETLKWSQMTKEQRSNQVIKAHKAIEEKDSEFFRQSSIKQAITKEKTQSKIGFLEIEIIKLLESKMIRCESQKAIDVYNLDIYLPDLNIDVEVHNSAINPHSDKRILKRATHLQKLGIPSVYLKVNGIVKLDKIIKTLMDLLGNNNLKGLTVINSKGEITTLNLELIK